MGGLMCFVISFLHFLSFSVSLLRKFGIVCCLPERIVAIDDTYSLKSYRLCDLQGHTECVVALTLFLILFHQVRNEVLIVTGGK
jgi:hypothetical protein